MKQKFLLLLLAATIATTISAETNHQLFIRGSVRAKSTNIPLVGAEVAIVMPGAKDTIKLKARGMKSTGTRSSRNLKVTSDFGFGISKIEPGDYEFIISYPDYEPSHHFYNFSDVGRREFNRDLGTFYLEKARPIQNLDEFTVTASKVKFYNKGDTIVYNADAFNLAEGSMLNELIKQFPGVELKEGGQIYVNGRYVESLMLNGKDFFKGDNLVLLENLGAYTVKDVQVYEKQTDLSRFAGRQLEENEYVMDVNLKKEYIGGWMFNAEGGYGTEDRYLGRFFGMNFDAKRRFTLYANVNNLSDKRTPGENSSWRPEYNSNGLLRHIESGFDYNVETGDEGKSYVTGNLSFKQDRTNLSTVSNAVEFYPSGNLSSRSSSGSVNRDMTLKTSHKLNLEKKNYMLHVEPSFSYRHRKSRSLSRRLGLNIELPSDTVESIMDKVFDTGLTSIDRSNLINATFNEAFSKSNTIDFSTIASSTIKVPRTSDLLFIWLQYSHRDDRYDTGNNYMIGYGDPDISSLARKQQTHNRPNRNHSIIAELSYRCILNDNWTISLVADQRYDRNAKESSFYMAQAEADATGDFSLAHLDALHEVLDPVNSYQSVETSQRFQINPVVTFRKSGIYAQIDVPLAHMSRHLDYNRGGILYPVKDSRWILRKATAHFMFYRNDKGTGPVINLNARYVANQDLPTLTRMIDIIDTTNPLSTYLGNSDLSTAFNHTASVNFSASARNLYDFHATVSANVVNGQFIQRRLYDTTNGYTTYQWLNSPTVTYRLSENIGGSIFLGKKRNFETKVSLGLSQIKDAMMSGENSAVAELYVMNTNNYSPGLTFGYQFGKHRVSAFGEVNFRQSTSTRLGSYDINSREFKYGVNGTFHLPLNFGISTDFNIYQRRGYDSPQLNTTDLVWNLRLSKSLNKGRWLLAVDGFDLLHQLSNITYSVSSSGRVETYSNTLPRYILFHVQYKINIMPKKKELTANTIQF